VSEGAVDAPIIGAMGYARLELAAAASTPTAAIEADLSSAIWRARDVRDEASHHLCVALFADWLKAAHPWLEEVDRADEGIVRTFAKRAISERFRMKCGACNGGGKLHVLPGGRKVLPRGVGRSFVKLVPCEACNGTGRKRAAAAERMKVLGRGRRRLDREEYLLLWHRLFGKTATWLGEIAAKGREHLRKASGGAKVRAQ